MLTTRILVSACVCAATIVLSGIGFGSEIFFDVDANSLPDTELTVNVGDAFVVAVYLGDHAMGDHGILSKTGPCFSRCCLGLSNGLISKLGPVGKPAQKYPGIGKVNGSQL